MAKDPNCGMVLEPKTVTAGTDDEENTELRDMTKRNGAHPVTLEEVDGRSL